MIVSSLQLTGHLFRLIYVIASTYTTNRWQFNLLVWRLFIFFDHVYGDSIWLFKGVISWFFFCCNWLPSKLSHFNFRSCSRFLWFFVSQHCILRLKTRLSYFTRACRTQFYLFLHGCLFCLYHRLLNFIDRHFDMLVLCYALNGRLFISFPFCLLP